MTMRRFIRGLAIGLGLAIFVTNTHAFSLLGIKPAWATAPIGYPTGLAYIPMNLGEEYRIGIPRVYYAFDESFLNYFGQKGVDEVDKAMQIVNDLPPVSEIDIESYPLYTARLNQRAASLGLVDMKTWTLFAMASRMGLDSPEAGVFMLRARQTFPNNTNYLVVKRNFDPITWAPSSFINGQLYSYSTILDNQDVPTSFPVINAADPLLLTDSIAGASGLSAGQFTTGFTRDDVGGLRYIYHPNNANAEFPYPSALVNGAGAAAGGFATGSGNPWGIPPFVTGTNAVTTVFLPNPSDPWGVPIFVTATNAGPVVNPGGGNFPPSVTNGAAIRRGVDKVSFVKTSFSPPTSQFFPPFVDTYQEQIVDINGQIRTISTTRIVAAPDLLFTARDLTGVLVAPGFGFQSDGFSSILLPGGNAVSGDADASPGTMISWITSTNNDTINGFEVLDGPGNLQFNVVSDNIAFNRTGPQYLNVFPGALGQPSTPLFHWGSYDGSTNAPFVYPQGSTIQEIEDEIFGGR